MANDNHDSHDASTGLPAGWVWMTLAKACGKVQDGSHFSPQVQYEESGESRYLYITAKNIKESGVDLSNVTYVDQVFHKSIYSRCDPAQGDVLLTKDGVKTGVATVNQLDEPFSLLSSVALLKPRKDVLDSRYLKHYLNSPVGFNMITGQMTGTAIKRIVLAKLKTSRIPVAPIDEQRRIVAEVEHHLTRLDAGVAALKRAQANLKRYKAAVLKAACEGKLVEQNPSDEPAPELLTRILAEWRTKWDADLRAKGKDSKKAKYEEPPAPNIDALPSGWCWTTMDALSATIGGVTKGRDFKGKKPVRLPYLRVANVQRGRLDLDEMKEIEVLEEEVEKYLLHEGDLVLTEGGDWDKLGRSAIWRNQIPNCIHQNHIFRARLYASDMPTEWLMYYTNSELGQAYFKDASKQTTNLASINLTQLRACPVRLPPLAEQRRIVAEVERRLSVVQELEATLTANLARAERLRQSILKRAFEGRL